MTIQYDDVISAFLNKITEYDFLNMVPETRQAMVDGYLHRAMATFAEVLSDTEFVDNREERCFYSESMTEANADEVIEILSEGMLVQWIDHSIDRGYPIVLAISQSSITSVQLIGNGELKRPIEMLGNPKAHKPQRRVETPKRDGAKAERSYGIAYGESLHALQRVISSQASNRGRFND